jgi:hypothetical protein
MRRHGAGAALLATIACAAFAADGAPRTVRGVLSSVLLHAEGSGTVGCCGQSIAVPADLRLEFPGVRLSMSEVFALAPAACRARGESGLLATDRCVADRGHRGRAAHILAEVSIGDRGTPVAGRVVISGTDDRVSGPVTFVHPTDGYLRIGGEYGVDAHGRMLRVNDPEARISIQQGAVCGGEGNCSPDVRFAFDANTPSVRFSTGGFLCVPSAVYGLCPPGASSDPGALLQPIRLGHHVVAVGVEQALRGSHVFVAHTLIVDQR